MEFYAVLPPINTPKKSFNSQRDGILLLLRVKKDFRIAFQFPTGWNSTVLPAARKFKDLAVSIPNGMEFYSTNFAIFLRRKS